MAYEKTVWVNGQAPALDADHLNKIEQGIADAVSVTPQTLSDGQKAQARGNIGAEQAGLNAYKTIYVSPSGNDNTGDGSQGNPFRQIQRAVDSLPKNLMASEVKISVAAGEYAGFKISGFSGTGITNHHTITVEGASRETTIITGGIEISACMCYVEIYKCTVKGASSGSNVAALHVHGIYVTDVALVGTTAVIGAWFDSCTLASIYYAEVSDKSRCGIFADGTTLYCGIVSGTNNAVAINSGSSSSGFGGIVVGYNSTIDGTIKYKKEYGGIIFMDGALV